MLRKLIRPAAAALMGSGSTEPANGSADWTCVRPGHWLFEGTGMREGDAIPGLVGWEHHGPPLGTMPGLEVLARGPVFSRGRPQKTEYAATMYPGPLGNTVFNAATIVATGNAEWAAVLGLAETWPAMIIGIAVFAVLTVILYRWIISRSARIA